ncbi:MAG: Ig-like domain-containing protein [Candidatus Omnitrophica bacterium]|nr:Ig-like domain-containing protein [Candidatus Omnitrophota bacterium]
MVSRTRTRSLLLLVVVAVSFAAGSSSRATEAAQSTESPPRLQITREKGQLVLSWQGEAMLQATDDLSSAWVDVPEARSPYTVSPASAHRFYRLRAPPPAKPLPTVTLTAPVSGTIFAAPATITLRATATAVEGTITAVIFFRDTQPLGLVTTSPYEFVWSYVPIGTYALHAEAVDSHRVTGTSPPVTVEVIERTDFLQNGSFETWRPGTNLPDAWLTSTGGVSRTTTDVRVGQAAVVLSANESHGAGEVLDQHLFQYLFDIADTQHADWRGKTVTFSAWVKTTTPNRVRVWINDGSQNPWSSSPAHTGSGAWERLAVTRTLSHEATRLWVTVYIQAGAAYVVTVDDARLVVDGSTARPPATEPGSPALEVLIPASGDTVTGAAE